MINTGIKEARQNLTGLLGRVEEGEEIVITKRGEPIAKISPFRKKTAGKLRSHRDLRAVVGAKGMPLSEAVRELRSEERY